MLNTLNISISDKNIMDQHPADRLFYIVLSIVYMIILSAVYLLDFKIFGDEKHYIYAIKAFSSSMSLETLRTYPEMATPLPFVLYAFWGKIAGFSPTSLRILSIIFSFVSMIFLWEFQKKFYKTKYINYISILVIFINPYFIGISITFYNDIIAFCFLAATFLFYSKKNYTLYIISAFLAILSRQYMLFFPAGVIISSFVFRLKTGRTNNLHFFKETGSSVLSILLILPLVILWKGFAPDSPVKEIYMSEGIKFYFNHLSLYFITAVVFSLPVIIQSIKKLDFSRINFVIAFIASIYYLVFPVKVSAVLADKTGTVGFFHKTLKYVFQSEMLVNTIFLLFFFLSIYIIILFVKYLKNNMYKKDSYFLATWIIVFFIFIILHGFSYHVWEKYFIPVLPVLLFTFNSVCLKQKIE